VTRIPSNASLVASAVINLFLNISSQGGVAIALGTARLMLVATILGELPSWICTDGELPAISDLTGRIGFEGLTTT